MGTILDSVRATDAEFTNEMAILAIRMNAIIRDYNVSGLNDASDDLRDCGLLGDKLRSAKHVLVMLGMKGIKNCYIAGGCFKDLLTNRNPKDFDVFFDDKDEFNRAFHELCNDKDWDLIYKNDNASCFESKSNKRIRVELISYTFGNVYTVINNFDFTVTKAAMVFDNALNDFALIYHKYFCHDLKDRVLDIDYKIIKPVSTMSRAMRYARYGYRIKNETTCKIAWAIKNMPRQDLEDIESALSYGEENEY